MLPFRWRDRLQVDEGRFESPRHLWVTARGESDLVEGEPDVAVPVEHPLDQPQLVVGVAEVAVREGPVGDLSQAVVQAV